MENGWKNSALENPKISCSIDLGRWLRADDDDVAVVMLLLNSYVSGYVCVALLANVRALKSAFVSLEISPNCT